MDVAEIIRNNIECEEPAFSILNFLRKHDGKLLNTKLVSKMIEYVGYSSIRISKQYNMTHINWGPYSNPSQLLISYQTVNVRIDAKWIEENNACWYSALRERNIKRKEALENPDVLSYLNSMYETINAAENNIKEAYKQYKFLEPDRIRIDEKMRKYER